MKINKIIFASDDSHFLEFWPIQAKLCKELFGWEPVLFKIDNEDSDFYYDGNGLVKKIKSVPGIHTAIQACIVRMFGTKYFEDEVCVCGDLDLLMINKNYFVEQLKHYNDDSLIIMSSDAYDFSRYESDILFQNEPLPFKQEMYGYMYNVGKGRTFSKILNLDCSFEDFVIRHSNYKDGYKIMWLIDEFYFSDCVNHNHHDVEIVKLKRGHYSEFLTPRRIERHNFPVELKWDGEILNQEKYGCYDVEKLKKGYYIDVNCVRPYSEYKEAIDNVVNIVIENGDNSDMYGIGLKYNTDKILTHRYDKIYEKFLEPLRKQKIKLFEIGSGSEAASFKMWIEYFENGLIYAMDINEVREQIRGKMFKGDQTKEEDLQSIFNIIGQCDIIIDDGSHQPQHQINSFIFLFEKMLKPGGIYIIEDIECNFWKPDESIYGYKIGHYNVLDFFSSLPLRINSDFTGLKNNLNIETISYYKNCIIITKKGVEDILGSKEHYRFITKL